MIGTVDSDNKGLSGIERYIDKRSADKPRGNEQLSPVQLSIDLRVQHVVVSELQKALDLYKAKAGAALVLDIRSGEVMALASLPSFDPQKRLQAQKSDRINRAMRGVYEMGSVLKAFTVAMGLDEGAVQEEERFDVATPIKLGRFVIKDHHKTEGWHHVGARDFHQFVKCGSRADRP